MELTEQLNFTDDDRREIYRYVESHGTATPKELERVLRLDPRGIRHHVAILKRDGYLDVAEDGTLSVAFEDEVREEHSADDVDFVIRQARQDDLSGLVGAIRHVAEEGTYIEAETVADIVEHEEVLLRHNELESRLFFVATVDDDVVGWVHLRASELDKLSHTAELTVGVLAAYRGHGIGSHLLKRGTQWAASHGYERLYNSVPATNEGAVAFLESHGWEVEAQREDHYKIDGEYVDEVMLDVTI